MIQTLILNYFARQFLLFSTNDQLNCVRYILLARSTQELPIKLSKKLYQSK